MNSDPPSLSRVWCTGKKMSSYFPTCPLKNTTEGLVQPNIICLERGAEPALGSFVCKECFQVPGLFRHLGWGTLTLASSRSARPPAENAKGLLCPGRRPHRVGWSQEPRQSQDGMKALKASTLTGNKPDLAFVWRATAMNLSVFPSEHLRICFPVLAKV